MRCQRRRSPLAHAGVASLALVLAACGPRGSAGGSGSGAAEDATANPAGEVSPEEIARLEARADRALRRALPEAPMRYAHVRPGFGGAICGELETTSSEAGLGGLRPFVVTRDGEAFVSSGPGLRLENAADPFPDLFMQWCATPDELQSIRRRLEQMRPSDVVATPPSANLSLPPAVTEEAPAEAPMPPPVAPRIGPPSGDEDFYNAVVRPRRNE